MGHQAALAPLDHRAEIRHCEATCWDWASRAVLAWRLLNTNDASFCAAALEEALLRFGKPTTTTPFCKKAATGGNLRLTEASIWWISAKLASSWRRNPRGERDDRPFDLQGSAALPGDRGRRRAPLLSPPHQPSARLFAGGRCARPLRPRLPGQEGALAQCARHQCRGDRQA